MAIINNVAYSWSMITLASTALGIDEGSTTLEGVSGIKWNKKRKIESNYGHGWAACQSRIRKPDIYRIHYDGLCNAADVEKYLRLTDGHRGV